MGQFSFSATREKAEKEGVLGKGDYLKLQEGPNKVRLMSECLEHAGEYQGKPTFKWLCYVLDRRDGKVKPYFMAHTIFKLLEALQEDPEYTFSETPMPYDITINAKGAGTKEVEYSVLPARTAVPLTPAERALWTGTLPVRDLQKALQEKQPAGATPTANSKPGPEDDGDPGPDIQVDMPA